MIYTGNNENVMKEKYVFQFNNSILFNVHIMMAESYSTSRTEFRKSPE